MKKVIEQALKGQTSYVKNDPDAVKLRLRGRGSGYKEGPDKKGNYFKNFNQKNQKFNSKF